MIVVLKRIRDFLLRNQTRIALTGCAGLLVSLLGIVLAFKNEASPMPWVFLFGFSLLLEVGGVALVLFNPEGN